MAVDALPHRLRGPWLWLLLAMAATAALQAAVAARSPIIAKDGIRFIRIARALERHPRAVMQQEDQHPGYPALISLAYRSLPRGVGGDARQRWELAARLPAMLAGVACVGLVWLLARRMFDARIAMVAALLIVPLPLFRRNASDTLSDTPHLACYLAAAWLACEGFAASGSQRRRVLALAGSGLASGLAFWIRPEGLSVALVATLVACGWWLGVRLAARRASAEAREVAEAGPPAPRLAWALLVCGTATLVVVPYVVLAGKLTSKKNPLARPASHLTAAAMPPVGPSRDVIQGEGGDIPPATSGDALPGTARSTVQGRAGGMGRLAPGKASLQALAGGMLPPAHLAIDLTVQTVSEGAPGDASLHPFRSASGGARDHLPTPAAKGVRAEAATARGCTALRQIGILAEPAAGERHADELERPAGFWSTLAVGLYQFGREGCEGLMYFLLVPLAAGHFAPGRPRPQRAAFWFLVVLAAWHFALLIALYFWAGYISHRHMMPLIAIGLPCTAAGTIWLAEWLARWGERLLGWVPASESGRWLLPSLVCIMLISMLPKCLEPGYLTHRSVVAAARWIHRHAQPGEAVLATSSYVRYYSGLPGLLLGVEARDLQGALGAAPKPQGWDYLVLEVDRRHFDETAQRLQRAGYQQVLCLPAHTRYPWLEVVLLRGGGSLPTLRPPAAQPASGGSSSGVRR